MSTASVATTAVDRAYQVTKDRILSGEIPAGELLSEVDVAQQLEVSRTPVHEAFLRLESEDLLRLIPRRGAVVVPVPPSEATDILEVRRALETAAVRRLAESGDLDTLGKRLDALMDEQAARAGAGDVKAFSVVDEEFHRAIVSASGNVLADRFYATLADRQRRMTIGAVGARPERLADLVGEHRALAALIAARDVTGFEDTLVRHMDATHHVFLRR